MGHDGLVSSNRLEKPEIDPRSLVYKAMWFIHYITAAPLFNDRHTVNICTLNFQTLEYCDQKVQTHVKQQL